MSFSFTVPMNTITPRVGMSILAYSSTRMLGSGVKPFLVIGVSPRYVTLAYITKLVQVKVKRKDWPNIVAEQEEVSQWTLRNYLDETVQHRMRAGRRYSQTLVDRIYTVILNIGANDNAGGSDTTSSNHIPPVRDR